MAETLELEIATPERELLRRRVLQAGRRLLRSVLRARDLTPTLRVDRRHLGTRDGWKNRSGFP